MALRMGGSTDSSGRSGGLGWEPPAISYDHTSLWVDTGFGASPPARSTAERCPSANDGELDPRLERVLVAPPRQHQPLVAVVGGPEQLEALEPVGVVDGTGACREPVRQLVTGARRAP